MSNLYAPVNLFTISIGEKLCEEKYMDIIKKGIEEAKERVFYEYGVRLPNVRIRSREKKYGPMEYSIDVMDNPFLKFTLEEDSVFLLLIEEPKKEMSGKKITEPLGNCPALWVPASEEEEAKKNGYLVCNLQRVLASHLAFVAEENAKDIITTQYVSDLLDEIAEDNEVLVDSLKEGFEEDKLSFGPSLKMINTVKQMLRSLLEERVSIKNIIPILEAISDSAEKKNPKKLLNDVRKAVARDILMPHVENDELHVGCITQSKQEFEKKIVEKGLDKDLVKKIVDFAYGDGDNFNQCLVCPQDYRRQLFDCVSVSMPYCTFISDEECLLGIKNLRNVNLVRRWLDM